MGKNNAVHFDSFEILLKFVLLIFSFPMCQISSLKYVPDQLLDLKWIK